MTTPRTILLCVVVLASARVGAAASDATRLKLRPGATGKVCFDCHPGIGDQVKKASVHTPLRKGECTGCHNPHASEHGKLLAAEGGQLCDRCHQMLPADAKSRHQPVVEHACRTCHDVHASDNAKNLVKAEKDVCATCHKELVLAAASVKHKHSPIERTGCTTCHQGHTSKSASLLKQDEQVLCTGCHKLDRPVLVKKHVGFPVGLAKCSECHDPHGSDNKGMLRKFVHSPVAKGACLSCHEAPQPAKPVVVKKAGSDLCKGCHGPKVTAMVEKSRVHWPVVDDEGCFNCHAPHAADQKGLVKGRLTEVCGTCHADTIGRQARSPTKHKPVAEGDCAKCHDAHSSEAPLMMINTNTVALCGTCHDWQKHSTHPLGPDKKDPRNPNASLQCLSCHRAHGTEYKHLMPFSTTTNLCVQCHQSFKR